MAKTCLISAYFFIILFIVSRLMSLIGKLKPWAINSLPRRILSLDLATRLRVDAEATRSVSSDFGKLFQEAPAAVLYPSSVKDIMDLVKFSNNCSVPFSVAARGHGHSVRGQATARNGVVVEMTSLNENGSSSNNGSGGIRVSWSASLGFYADLGGQELWIDVLRSTLEHGVAPVSWTDYLYLTVGGTLSNAGISGQTFRHGPQISNVHEMDVITGKGEFVTCSKHVNSELFFAVLGGLGQFGIITRARIALDKAPSRVKWVRMLYHDFSAFTRDQEHLISNHGGGLDYLEGSLIMKHSPPNNWRSSFFSPSHQSKIASLLTKHGILYCLEVVKHYDHHLTVHTATVDQELELVLQGLTYASGFVFKKDVSYVDFLNRVRSGELMLQSKGLWDVPHPWLNLFVPRSRIMDFNAGVFLDIILRQNKPAGPILVYPMLHKMWDDRMSAVIPEEETFYTVGLLHSSGPDGNWEILDDQNKAILEFCDRAGIRIKQYLPHYSTTKEWMEHFGSKWDIFQQRKALFDPNLILSPGQGIFN